MNSPETIIEDFMKWIESEGKSYSLESDGGSIPAEYRITDEIIRAYSEEIETGLLEYKDLSRADFEAVITPSSALNWHLETKLAKIASSSLHEASISRISELFTEASKTRAEIGLMTCPGYPSVTDQSARDFVKILCMVRGLPSTADQSLSVIQQAEDYQSGVKLRGIADGYMSQVLHALKPEVFPIINGKAHYGDIVKLKGSFWEKARTINELRAKYPWWPRNHRAFDVFCWGFDESNNADEPSNIEEASAMNANKNTGTIKLNTILYGPPGTGKTYNTTAYAVAICEGKLLGDIQREVENPDNHEGEGGYKTVKKRFEEYKKDGRIAFVTFHQSYGYENFIEGIRPILPCDDGYSGDGEIEYDVIDGIFKEMSDRAREFTGHDDTAEASLGEDEVESIIEQYASYIQESNDEGNEVPLKGNVTITAVNRYRDGRPRSFVLGGSNTSHQWVSFKMVRRDFADYCAGNIKSPSDVKATRGDKPHGNAMYLFALYGRIQEFIKGDDYKQQPKLEKDRKNFVIIIDEINRGNISKIFGELITLIEEDKREGGKNPIGVTLPHSPEEFYVPDNLYVLGTMNTADRSIALMDTALRRRFDFVEMMPNPDLVKDDSGNDIVVKKDEGGIAINVREIMVKINARIEALYDREHTIGHSYFMDIRKFEDLKEKFEKEIIPLLQEYFYDDYEKIRLVLADSMTEVEEHQFVWEHDIASDLFEGMDSDLVPEKKIFGVNNGTVTGIDAFDDPLSYIKIYSMSEYSAAKG